MEEKILTFQKKIAKIPLPSPHLAAMNSEFTAAWRGAIYRHRPKAPVGANDPVPNLAHGHRVILPTGAFRRRNVRHRVVASPGAFSCTIGTG